MRRLYIEPDEFSADEVRLTGAQARRLTGVLRMRAGTELRVFDGRGSERLATITHAARASATLRLGRPVDALPEPPVAVTLACAFPRGARGDWIVEKATELGVSRIVPLRSRRSVMSAGTGRVARWRRIAIEAAEQCGRAVLPEIVDAVPSGALELVASLEGGVAVRDALDGFSATSVVLYVGPEGGWTEQESQEHDAAGRIAAALGPRTLRVETAAVIGLAQVLEATGGLDAPKGRRPTA